MARRRLPKKYHRGRHNCLQRAIALVTRRPLRKVPHFLGLYGGRWPRPFAAWCERIGYFVIIAEGLSKKRHIRLSEHPDRWIEIGTDNTGGCHAVIRHRNGRLLDRQLPLRRVEETVVLIKRDRHARPHLSRQ